MRQQHLTFAHSVARAMRWTGCPPRWPPPAGQGPRDTPRRRDLCRVRLPFVSVMVDIVFPFRKMSTKPDQAQRAATCYDAFRRGPQQGEVVMKVDAEMRPVEELKRHMTLVLSPSQLRLISKKG